MSDENEIVRVFSNLQIFYEIAIEAFEKSEKYLSEHRTPKANEKGYILTLDPEKKSFKQGLISVSFFGSYIDVYIRLAHIIRKGSHPSGSWDRKIYEDKLKSLGIDDQELLNSCKEFRLVRNDIAHEKPIIAGKSSKVRSGTAQAGAKLGMAVVAKLQKTLPLNPN